MADAAKAPVGRDDYNGRMKLSLLVAVSMLATSSGAQNVDRLPDAAARSVDWPIVLIVPFPPGGSAERVGRILSASLSDSLHRSVVVRNMPGGIGVDALAAVAKPVPGEIRVGYATNTQIVPGALLSKPATFNPGEDFDWIGVVGTFGGAVVVGPAERAGSFELWLKDVPQRARPLRLGAGAPGSMSMLAAQFLSEMLGGQIETISISAADAGYAALRRGEIDAYIDGLPNALEEVPAASARILAVSSKDRSAAVPDVPSFGERWPGEDFSTFVAIVAAKSESEAVRGRLKSGWYGVNRAGTARKELTTVGITYLGLDLDAATAYVEREMLRHAKLLTRFGRPR
jgi:tripartite-type tricarboxylate transporter receptor subunit TctC